MGFQVLRVVTGGSYAYGCVGSFLNRYLISDLSVVAIILGGALSWFWNQIGNDSMLFCSISVPAVGKLSRMQLTNQKIKKCRIHFSNHTVLGSFHLSRFGSI